MCRILSHCNAFESGGDPSKDRHPDSRQRCRQPARPLPPTLGVASTEYEPLSAEFRWHGRSVATSAGGECHFDRDDVWRMSGLPAVATPGGMARGPQRRSIEMALLLNQGRSRYRLRALAEPDGKPSASADLVVYAQTHRSRDR